MPSSKDRLTRRIRTECARRGWDLQTLADRADVSRTALYHLLEGHTARPRGVTLNRLAAAFDLPVEELLAAGDQTAAPPVRPVSHSPAARFDRATNPEVDAIATERPHLFRGWSESDWDELYSTFGAGGALSRQGVIASATAINRKRETIRRLHIVMETHLRVVAEELIDTLYRQVRPQSNLTADESLRALLAESRPADSLSPGSDAPAALE